MTLIACAIVPLASMAARANGWTVLHADRDLSLLQSAAVTVTPEEVEQLSNSYRLSRRNPTRRQTWL